ncbi:MAG TPA: hypothetical protein VLK34_07660 [Nocardioidaceae bacterium]|nr:hypothetical protein [Nocardioidaceae bacterium]
MTVTSLAPLSQRNSRQHDAARRQPSSVKLEQARRAAGRARRLQGDRVDGRVIEVLPALSGLLPGGGLAPGATYAVSGSTALAAALIAEPSTRGMWCGVVAMPGFAAEGAAGLGCDLDRLIFVPHPGREWVNIAAALVDALAVVVVKPQGRVSDAEAARLSARLRQREAVLIACGEWPRADVRLSVTATVWHGLGRGHGHLTARRADVAVSARGQRLSTASIWLPDARGQIALVDGMQAAHGEPLHESLLDEAVG